MVPPIKNGPEAEKIGGFFDVGFVVEYEGEWGVEWSENVHKYPVEIERRMLTRVYAVDMWARPSVWYLVGKFFRFL